MSEYNTEEVTVIFRTWKHGQFKGDVEALFPYMPHNPLEHTVTSYDMISGHCSADYRLMLSKTRPSREDEYKELKHHLETVVGYKLKVAQKVNYDTMLAAFTEVRSTS